MQVLRHAKACCSSPVLLSGLTSLALRRGRKESLMLDRVTYRWVSKGLVVQLAPLKLVLRALALGSRPGSAACLLMGIASVFDKLRQWRGRGQRVCVGSWGRVWWLSIHVVVCLDRGSSCRTWYSCRVLVFLSSQCSCSSFVAGECSSRGSRWKQGRWRRCWHWGWSRCRCRGCRCRV